MIRSYQKDIYKCTNCNGWIASGDNYCKHCAYKFTTQDVDKMIEGSTFFKRWHAPLTSSFDNVYNCTSCKGRISQDLYCKHCGFEITNYDVRVMRGDYKPNTVKTFKFSILFFIFVILFFLLVFSTL